MVRPQTEEARRQEAFVQQLQAAGHLTPGGPIKVDGVDVPVHVPGDRAVSTEERCTEIADQVVPQYRDDNQRQPGYSCTGIYAKRWQAAWDAACIALGGDPAEYRR